MRRNAWLVFLGVAVGACSADTLERTCTTDDQCLQDRNMGTCLPSPASTEHWCAFPVTSCPSRLRWGLLTGDGLADQCVAQGGIDAGVVDAGTVADAGPGRLSIDHESYSFGAVAPGQSVERDFAVTNVGGTVTGELAVTVTGSDAAAFALDASDCQGQTLAVGVGCSIKVTFTTNTEVAKHATLAVSAAPGGTVTSSLDGSGLAPATLSSDPPSLDFGTVTNGSSSSAALTIRNGGALATGTLTVGVSGADAARFSTVGDNCVGKTLAAGTSCTLGVSFAPTVSGARAAKVSISDGVKGIDVPLAGSGVAAGTLSLTPSTPTFATVALGSSTTAMVVVKNTGGTTLATLATAISGTGAADFSLTTDTCKDQELAAGATCAITVKFQPSVAGTKSASFAVTSASGGGISTPLSATATANLAVTLAGTGHGTVSSNPAGISCGSACSADFAATSVQLTASPNADSTFGGWSGACTGTTTCTVALTAAKSVTATFTIKTYTLTIAKAGTGSGTVMSSPPGIDCGATCTQEIVAGQSVLLNATPDAHNTFTSWSGGGCTGTSGCLVVMNGPVTVTASFTRLITFTVGILATAPNSRIFSDPAGLDCTDTSSNGQTFCTHDFLPGTVLTLSEVPGAGLYFGGWIQDCPTDAASTPQGRLAILRASNCRLTVDRALTTVAEFTSPITITITITTSGSGTVTSIPPGIQCPPTCTSQFSAGGVSLGFVASKPASWSANLAMPGGCGASDTYCETGGPAGIGYYQLTQTIGVTFP